MTQPNTEHVQGTGIPDETSPFEEPGPDSPPRRAAPAPRVLAVIALGGFAGGVARYELGLAFPTAHGTFPATTFGINVAGSFILALLMVFVLEIWPPTTYIRPLFGIGFCGAFTTFSTMAVGADQLIADGRTGTALGYLFGSLAAGLGAASLGLTIGRSILAARHRAGRADHADEPDHAAHAAHPERGAATAETQVRA